MAIEREAFKERLKAERNPRKEEERRGEKVICERTPSISGFWFFGVCFCGDGDGDMRRLKLVFLGFCFLVERLQQQHQLLLYCEEEEGEQ